jgi:hypothetical protein
LDETEDHIASLHELLRAYEYGLHNAERARDRRLVAYLAARVAHAARQLTEARTRRDRLRRELQSRAP